VARRVRSIGLGGGGRRGLGGRGDGERGDGCDGGISRRCLEIFPPHLDHFGVGTRGLEEFACAEKAVALILQGGQLGGQLGGLGGRHAFCGRRKRACDEGTIETKTRRVPLRTGFVFRVDRVPTRELQRGRRDRPDKLLAFGIGAVEQNLGETE